MRVIQRYNRKICFTEFFDLYRLEIKLCLIIKTLGGLRGLAPVLPSGSPHRPIARFHTTPPIIAEYAPMGGKIAVVEVKNPFVDFDRRDCTALSLRRFFKSSKEDKRWRCSVMTK